MVLYDTTNTTQTHTASAGTTLLTIEVDGAQGGDGGDGTVGGASGGSGGLGGLVSGEVTTTAGESFSVYIAEAGASVSLTSGGAGGRSPFGDGGSGGDGTVQDDGNGGGGGGGGGSSAVERDSDTTVLLVGEGGGGGGGGGGTDIGANGGTGGGGARGGSGAQVGDGTGDGGDGGSGGSGSNTSPSAGAPGGAGGTAVDAAVANVTQTTGGATLGAAAITITEDGIRNLAIDSTGTDSVTLSWDDAPNETGYDVQYREAGTSTWTTFSTPGAGTTTETITGLSEGTDYEFRVGAVTSAGTSFTNAVSTTTTLPAPTALSATVQNGDDIALSWTLQSSDEDGVRVYRSRDGGATLTQIADLAAGTTSFTDTGLLDGEQYTYEVRAYTTDTESASNQASATTVLPDAQQPTADASVEDELTLTWTDVTDYGTYQTEIRRTGDTEWLAVPSNTTVVEPADSTTDWFGDTDTTVATTTAVSEDGTSIAATRVNNGGGSGDDDFGFSAGGVALGDVLQVWVQIDSDVTPTLDVYLSDGTNSATVSLVDAGEAVDDGRLFQVDASAFAGVDTSTIQTVLFRPSAWDYGDTIYIDSVVTGDRTVPETQTSLTASYLADGEQYDVRLRTQTEHVTGAWAAITDVTLLPADTSLTITGREGAVDASITDNADNEDGRRLQRSTDGGSTWTTVDSVSPATTTFSDASPPLYEVVEYRSQVYTEHVVANSTTVSTVPVRAEEFYAELELDGSVTVITPDDIPSASVSPEHTGIWGAELTVAPGAQSALDYALYETRLYYGATQFFDGETKLVSVGDGEATLRGDGKAIGLEEDTEIVTYPDAVSTTTGVPIHDAVTDYWGRTPASVTVYDYPARTVRTGETFADAPATQSFTTLIDTSDDEPLVTSASELKLAQTAFFLEAEDAGDGAFSVVDDTAIADRFSAGQAAELSTSLQNFQATFTLDHRVPADDIEIQYRAARDSFEGDIYITLDNLDVGYLQSTPANSKSIRWVDGFNLAANATVDSIPDLQPGSHTVGVEVRDPAPGDSNVNVSGSLYVDAIVPYDTGSRFGGFAYTFDNTVADPNARLSGPQEHPDSFDARVPFSEVWHVPSADLTISTTDSSTSPRLALSPDDSNFVTATNTTSLSADFDAAGYYGTEIVAEVRLERQDSGNAQSPSSGDASQVVDDLLLTVDTDDLALLTSDDPLVLDADTHLENLQTLHEAGQFRFVMDHEADGLVVESFRRGDAAVAKSATWTTEANGVDVERDTIDYANRLRGTGDGVSTDVRMTSEVNRVGTEIIDSVSFPNVTDRAELVAKTRRELIARSSNDQLSGTLSIAPKLVKVGYPYTVPEFDGETESLNAVQFSFGDRTGRGKLTFGGRRGVGAQLSQRL